MGRTSELKRSFLVATGRKILDLLMVARAASDIISVCLPLEILDDCA